MTEYEGYPTWLYKPVEVDNLSLIQEELMPILYREIPDFDNDPPHFIYVPRENIEPYAPRYTEFIASLGIVNRWYGSALVTTNRGIPYPIHVDGLDWHQKCYGLNLPLINCDDTYTVFYDAEIETEAFTSRGDPKNSARKIKPGTTPTEIGRWESNKPAWINTRIPHCPLSNHTRPRAIISARFYPEVHEIFNT